jgi:hypothetical protein
MSVDDQLNPNDGSLIDKIDSVIFEFNKKLAKKWQDKTYKSKEDLEKMLYYGSSAACIFTGVNTKDYSMIIFAAIPALQGTYTTSRMKSSKEQEIQSEAMGLPTKFFKYANVALYGMGAFMTFAGIGYTAASFYTGSSTLLKDSLSIISLGLSAGLWATANYMTKSDIGSPPPKPKKKPITEYVKDALGTIMPQPTPQPIRVRHNIENKQYE